MNYIKQKRNQKDRCNICGKTAELTWDHIPPKSILTEPNTYANTLFSKSSPPSPNQYMKHYQSGIKYRTICAECNNVILGKNDKALQEFSEEVVKRIELSVSAMQKGIAVPAYIKVEVQINRALRAICGHFLAMKTFYDDQVETDKNLRKYVLDESLRFDVENLFCWFYPYSTIVNVRDVTVSGFYRNAHPKGFISVMEIYPLAYMVSSKDESLCLVDNLGKYSTKSIDEKVSVILHFNTALYPETNIQKDFIWPVNVSDDVYGAKMVLGNTEISDGSRIGVTTK